jgi:hypothetical protein
MPVKPGKRKKVSGNVDEMLILTPLAYSSVIIPAIVSAGKLPFHRSTNSIHANSMIATSITRYYTPR